MAHYVVLDTETAPLVKHSDNKAHPETSAVYDFGYCVVDGSTNTAVCERSFVVAETFYNTNAMNSAYYADKLPQCREGIKNGDWTVASFLEIWRTFKADCKQYNVKTAWAYNCRFDEIALNNTIRTYSNGYVNWFIPFGIKVRDIWDYASNITNSKSYLKFIVANGLFTATGNPSTRAETVYKFLTKNRDYVECHTALEDAKIELKILLAAKAKKTKTRHSSKGQGWRDSARAFKELELN